MPISGCWERKWASAVVPHFWAPTIMKPSLGRQATGGAGSTERDNEGPAPAVAVLQRRSMSPRIA